MSSAAAPSTAPKFYKLVSYEVRESTHVQILARPPLSSGRASRSAPAARGARFSASQAAPPPPPPLTPRSFSLSFSLPRPGVQANGEPDFTEFTTLVNEELEKGSVLVGGTSFATIRPETSVMGTFLKPSWVIMQAVLSLTKD